MAYKSISDYLSALAESDLHVLLRDLLREMGFQTVTITHGALEAGRDLVFSKFDELGRLIWRGAQVKAFSLSGSLTNTAKGARALAIQAQAALDTPFCLPSGETVFLKEVWIITSHPLSEQAKSSVAGFLANAENVVFVDGPKLADLIAKYLPNLVESGSAPIADYLMRLREFCDSPEEYLTVRLRGRFSLNDVFVPPKAHLRLLLPDRLRAKAPLIEIFRMSDLEARLAPFIVLSRRRLLPLMDTFQMRELLSKFVPLTVGAEDMAPLRQSALTLTSSIETLFEIAGMNGRSASDDPKTCDAVTIERLEEIDYCFRRVQPRLGSEFRTRAELAASLKKARNEDEEFVIKRDYRRFYLSLVEKFRLLLLKDDPSLALVNAARDAFYEIASSNLTREESQLLGDAFAAAAKLRAVLTECDGPLRDWYQKEWPDDAIRHLSAGSLPEDTTSINALGQANRVTWFLHAIANLEPADCIYIDVDCLRLPDTIARLLYQGELGAGKTTVMKKIADGIARRAQESDLPEAYPILSYLGGVKTRGEIDIRAAISLSAQKTPPEALVREGGESIVWLLDGLDEVDSVDARRDTLKWACSESGPQRVVITSRPSAVPANLPGFTRVELEGFDRPQMEEFVRRFPWSAPNADQGGRLMDLLEKAPELAELARKPLLLTLIAQLVQVLGIGILPTKREPIYDLMMRLFLGEWDQSKRNLEREYTLPDLSARIRCLSMIAFRLYDRHARAFSKQEFVATAMQAAPNHFEHASKGQAFFDDLVRDCMLIPFGRADYSFFHLSMHEYLAARELAHQVELRGVWHAIEQYFRTGWWEEVLVFYAEMKGNVASIINDLNLHLAGDRQRVVRLLSKWFEVARYMPIEELNPRGTVASIMANLNLADKEQYWSALARE